eukprot:CAMPEP_0168827196 /NCGR_PEP_ID=MMETSP0726-20121227/12554_1 /TAXON_ID=265536 /ORGANISM="Amphiprora sp., Strain CCMP467" /LENGTH=240 /DNA_ID=CAMNT_0008880359 /DNA_START=65 /DNA_END=787 /DNA_ORIENTATION=-
MADQQTTPGSYFSTNNQEDVSSIASGSSIHYCHGSSIHYCQQDQPYIFESTPQRPRVKSKSECDAEDFVFGLKIKIELLQEQELRLDAAYKENKQQAKEYYEGGNKAEAIATMKVVQRIQSQRYQLVHTLDEMEEISMEIKSELTRQRTMQALQHAAKVAEDDGSGQSQDRPQVQIKKLGQFKRQVERLDAEQLADSFVSSVSLQQQQQQQQQKHSGDDAHAQQYVVSEEAELLKELQKL